MADSKKNGLEFRLVPTQFKPQRERGQRKVTKYRWPKELTQETYESLLERKEDRQIFYAVLDQIETKIRQHGGEWLFDSSEMSNLVGTGKEKVDDILNYIFNLKFFRVDEPTISKHGGKFIARSSRFSEEKVERTEAKYEVRSGQRKIENYFNENFPDRKIQLNEKQVEEIKVMLDSLKELHEKSTVGFGWQECLASYELIKFRTGETPDENEVATFIGLGEPRLKGRNWAEKIRENGYKVEFSKHVPIPITRREEKLQLVKTSYKKLKEEQGAVTIESLKAETKISKVSLKKYVGELALKLESMKTVSRKSNEKKVRASYEKFDGEFLPSRAEIAGDIGISRNYAGKLCQKLKLPLLNDNLLKKKLVYLAFKKFENEGGDVDNLTHGELLEYAIDMGYEMTSNTLKKWRRELEAEGKLPIPKIREAYKPKYIKYKDAYLEIVNKKIERGERIRLNSVANELSNRFNEAVPEHRVWKLRNVTGVPKLLDNEERYQNIVDIYNKDPEVKIEDWAEQAKVSIGFLYDALHQFKKDSKLLEKFGATGKIVSKLKVSQNPLLKAFKAIGNTNRIKILKSLADKGGSSVSKVIENLDYDESKWRDTIEYHLDVLEDADMIKVDRSRLSVTQKGEALLPVIGKWDLEEVVPEEIFGPGYNKPLFALAVSKREKQLMDIVSFMREKKGHVPFNLPSSESPERKPVHDYEPRKGKFKRYFDDFWGNYNIKEKYFPFLADVIENVRSLWSPKDLVEVSKSMGLDYMKIRQLTVMLADNKVMDEFDTGLSEEEAQPYMKFVGNNFFDLCKRMSLSVPYISVKLDYDDKNQVYVLRVK